jgi:parvulin-like peptidyl-prolyl isomerase
MTHTARGVIVSLVRQMCRRRVARVRRPAPLAPLAVLLPVALLLAVGCGGSTAHPADSASPVLVPSSPAPAVVAAHVNGEVVTRAEVERTIDFSRLSSKRLSYSQALEATIRSQLLSHEAARLGVSVADSDAGLQARLAQVAASLGGTAVLQQSLAVVGLSLADYRQELRAGLLAERLGARKFPAAVAGRRQALAFYRAHRGQLTTPAAVWLAEIAVKTRSLGQAVIDRLRQGYPFAGVARAYSMDPESASSGGVIGWVVTSSLPQPLARALIAARTGVVVGPVAAVGEWHVLKVLGRRRAHTQPFAEARPAIVAQLTVERRAALLSAWLAKARARAHVTFGS